MFTHYTFRARRLLCFVLSIFSGYNHHMVTLYLNGNPPWLKVFGDDQKPRVVVVTVLTSLILLLYDGLMVCHVIYNIPGSRGGVCWSGGAHWGSLRPHPYHRLLHLPIFVTPMPDKRRPSWQASRACTSTRSYPISPLKLGFSQIHPKSSLSFKLKQQKIYALFHNRW